MASGNVISRFTVAMTFNDYLTSVNHSSILCCAGIEQEWGLPWQPVHQVAASTPERNGGTTRKGYSGYPWQLESPERC